MKKYTKYISIFSLLLSVNALAETKTVTSPNGTIVVSLADTEGAPVYQVQYRGETIIKKSKLGLEFKDINGFVRDLHIGKSTTQASNSTWAQPWGERKIVRDNHKELAVEFIQNQKPFNRIIVRVKVFDDGIGLAAY